MAKYTFVMQWRSILLFSYVGLLGASADISFSKGIIEPPDESRGRIENSNTVDYTTIDYNVDDPNNPASNSESEQALDSTKYHMPETDESDEEELVEYIKNLDSLAEEAENTPHIDLTQIQQHGTVSTESNYTPARDESEEKDEESALNNVVTEDDSDSSENHDSGDTIAPDQSIKEEFVDEYSDTDGDDEEIFENQETSDLTTDSLTVAPINANNQVVKPITPLPHDNNDFDALDRIDLNEPVEVVQQLDTNIQSEEPTSSHKTEKADSDHRSMPRYRGRQDLGTDAPVYNDSDKITITYEVPETDAPVYNESDEITTKDEEPFMESEVTTDANKESAEVPKPITNNYNTPDQVNPDLNSYEPSYHARSYTPVYNPNHNQPDYFEEPHQMHEADVDMPGKVDGLGDFYEDEYKLYVEKSKYTADDSFTSYHTITYFLVLVFIALCVYVLYTYRHRLYRTAPGGGTKYVYSRLGEAAQPLV